MSTINSCPHCGINLSESLRDGIAHCQNCNRVFDSKEEFRIMSAYWQARNQNFTIEQIASKTGLKEPLATFIHLSSVFSYDEFVELLNILRRSLDR